MAEISLKHKTRKAGSPSRLRDADLAHVGRNGFMKIAFDYEGRTHSFVVPFTRPYKNQEEQIFAALVNLNQGRSLNNLEFAEFERRVSHEYEVEVVISPCTFEVINNG